jgi:hypothetical protein
MSKRRDRYSRPKSSSFSISSMLPWFFGCFLIAGIIGYMIIRPPAVDQKTFCNQDRNIPGVTVLLIDVSDKLSNSQKARLDNELLNISNTSSNRTEALLSKGEKLVVYFVEQEGIKPSLSFSMCHPGDVSKRTLVEKFSEGKSFAKKKWEKFHKDTTTQIDKKINETPALGTSPIIENIQYIRSKEFPPPSLISDNGNYNLIIWSDMIQNSQISNHFQKINDYKKVLRETPLVLNDIKIRVFQLMSKKYIKFQTNEQLMWWRKIFSSSQGNLKLWEPL